MEPVEIEIKMTQNVSEESEKATAGMDDMTQKLQELDKALADQRQAYKMIKDELIDYKKLVAELKNQVAAMTVETEKAGKTATDELNIIANTSEKAADSVDDMAGAFLEFAKMLANPKQALKQLNGEIIAQKAVVNELIVRIAMLNEESRKGNKETAAELNKLQAEYEEEVTTLDAFVEMQRALSAEMSTATARTTQLKNEMTALRLEGKEDTEQYALLREELEKLMKAQSEVRNESSMRAATEGLIQGMSALSGAVSAGAGAMALFGAKSKEMEAVQTRLQSLIAITVGLQQASNALNERSAFMTNTVAKAKRLWASAVQFLNVQLGITNTLSKLLVASGIGAIIAAVGLLIVKLQDYKQEQEEVNEVMTVTEEINKKASDNMAKNIAEIEALRTIIKSETATLEEKKSAIAQLTKIIPDYNAEIDTTGKLIRENISAVEEYMVVLQKQMRMEAAREQLIPLIQKQFDLDKQRKELLDEMAKQPSGPYENFYLDDSLNPYLKMAENNKERVALMKEMQELYQIIEQNYVPGKSNITTKQINTKQTTDNTLSEQKRLIQEQIALWERYYKYVENGYSVLAYDLLRELQKGGINLEDYLANQKAKITGQMVDIETVLSGGVSAEDRKVLEAELAKLGDSLDIVIDAEIKLSYDQSKEARERKKMLDGILAEYATYTEKRIAIDQKYAALRKSLEDDADIDDKAGAMAKLNESYQDEVDALAMAALKGEEAFAKLGGNIKKLGKEALKQLASDLNKLKIDERFAESAEAVKAIDDAIEQVNTTIEDQTIDNIEKMKDALFQVVNAVSDIVSEFDTLDGNAAKVVSTIGKIGKGFASGGVVGAAVAYLSSWASGLNEAISYYKNKDRLEEEERIAKQLALQNYEYRQQIELLDEINRLTGIDRTTARAASIENITKKEQELLDELRNQKLFIGTRDERKWYEFWKGEKKNNVETFAKVFGNMSDEELMNATAQDLADRYNQYIRDAAARGDIEYGKNGWLYSVTAADIEANETLANYLDLLKEYQDLMRQLEDEQFQDTYGFGYSDLLNDFMNTLSESEDDLEKWGKSFEDVWKKYVLNTIKRTIAEDYINQLVEQIKKANEDGSISAEEYEELKRFWEVQGVRAEAEMRTLEQIYGLQDDIDSVREGMKGAALARASQESIDELTGGVYAVRMATADIRNYAREQLVAMQTMASQLDVIAQNSEYLERLDAMQRDIEDIKIKGIKVKV